jgi:hypothetical protein
MNRGRSFSRCVRTLTACTLCAFAAPMPAQDTQTGKTPGTQVQSGQVNLEFSRVYVHALKKGFGHEHAVIGKLKDGSLHLAGSPQAGGRLVFDMTSFDADGPTARKYVGLEGQTDAGTRKQVNENLLGEEVLDVKNHPTAEFEIDRVALLETPSPRGLPQCRLEGKFSLHGRTNPLSVEADIEDVRGWKHIRGKFTILQTEYGIKPYTKAFGAVGVADELTIFGDLYVAP